MMKLLNLPKGVALVAALLLATLVVSAAYGTSGANGQLTSVQCVSVGGGSCTTAAALDEPIGIARSTDETHVFVASHTGDSVSIFNRSAGLLSLPGGLSNCISEDGTGGACAHGRALDGATDVEARDNNAYVASANSGAVALIKANNGLSNYFQPSNTNSCISETGSSGACAIGRALTGASSLAFGVNYGAVYVGGTGSIAVFSRNKTSGLLTQLGGTAGCVNDDGSEGCVNGFVPDTVRNMRVSTDGKFLYAAASGPGEGAVLVFSINPVTGAITQLPGTSGCISDDGSTGQCTVARALLNPTGVASDIDSTGGLNVYVAANGSDAVAVFSRNKTTGALTQLAGTAGCVSATGAGGCSVGHAITGPVRVNVYKTNLYVEVTAGDGVASFGRDKHTGVLTQLPGRSGCTSLTGSGNTCLVAPGLGGAGGIVSTGGGKNVYVAGSTSDAVDVLHLQ